MTGDRDTLTDEERNDLSGIIKWHMNCYGDDPSNQSWKSLCVDNVNLAVERIVAARVRAAQAQAWDEACDHHYQEGDLREYDDEGNEIGNGCPENPYQLGNAEQGQHEVDRAEGEEHAGSDEVVSSHDTETTPELEFTRGQRDWWRAHAIMLAMKLDALEEAMDD